MAAISQQDFITIVFELESLKTKFVALEMENQRLLEDLQNAIVEKQQQHNELTRLLQQL